nr:hypothetical protein [Tanacetum cinerariifolium]
GVISIIVGTINAIHKKESKWYIGCKVCKKKVIRSSYMVDFEADVMVNMIGGAQNEMFRLQICVQDESGTIIICQLRDKYGKARIFKGTIKMCSPTLVGKKIAFKKLSSILPLFTPTKYVRNKILKQQAHHFRQSLRWI